MTAKGLATAPGLHTGRIGEPPASPIPPDEVPMSHTARSISPLTLRPLRPKSAYETYSRPRARSIARNSLSRKLQNWTPSWVAHCVLSAILIGWLHASRGEGPVPVARHALTARNERP